VHERTRPRTAIALRHLLQRELRLSDVRELAREPALVLVEERANRPL
jgi:hypothetical protein